MLAARSTFTNSLNPEIFMSGDAITPTKRNLQDETLTIVVRRVIASGVSFVTKISFERTIAFADWDQDVRSPSHLAQNLIINGPYSRHSCHFLPKDVR